MKKYFISLGKRLAWIVLFFIGIPLIIVPYTLTYLFCGGDFTDKKMVKLEGFIFNLLD